MELRGGASRAVPGNGGAFGSEIERESGGEGG